MSIKDAQTAYSVKMEKNKRMAGTLHNRKS